MDIQLDNSPAPGSACKVAADINSGPFPTANVRVVFFAPTPWDGPWGHGKDLARLLSAHFDLLYLEQIGLEGHRGLLRDLLDLLREAVSPGLTIIRRQSQFSSMALWYGVYTEIKNLLDAMRLDYEVMATYYTICTSLACLYTKLRGRKVLLIYSDDLPALFRPRLARIAARYVFTPLIARLADQVVATSHRLMEDMLRYNRRTSYIPNGVNLSRFQREPARVEQPNAERCVVGFVGSFGHWIDFEPMLAVAQRHPSITFLLVGDGDQYDEMAQRTVAFPNVELTGAVPFSEVASHLDRMGICLIPFKRNRLTDAVSPIKLFEYWAMGKPVISTRFYEITKVGDGAVLFADTETELETAILSLRTDHALCAHLVEQGFQRVKACDWNVLVQQYLSVIESIGMRSL